MMSSSKACRTR